MSSFKQLSKSDVTVVANNANKQWNLEFSCFPTSSQYLTIYRGTNLTSSFSFANDPKSQGQYERLIYAEINQLFYQSYTASLNTSSLASSIYYESASQQRPTASYFIFNDNANFTASFPSGSNETIRVISINQNVYGNKVLPGSFVLTSSAYNIKDDSYGNLRDGSTHIGNIFYAQGLAVITSQDYQLMFPVDSSACTTTTTTTSTTTTTTTAPTTTTTTSTTTTTTTAPTTTTTSTTTTTTTVAPTTYSASIYARFGDNTTNPTTASVYYTTASAGPYNLLGNIWDNTCTNFGTVTVDAGSTLYFGVLSGSQEVAFQASNTGSCPTPGVTQFCGTSSMYSIVMNQNEEVSVQAKVVANVLALCNQPTTTTTTSTTTTTTTEPTTTTSTTTSTTTEPTTTTTTTSTTTTTTTEPTTTTTSTTTTTTTVSCNYYEIVPAGSISVEYFDCSGNYTTNTYFSQTTICAETGTVNQTGGSGTITEQGSCS